MLAAWQGAPAQLPVTATSPGNLTVAHGLKDQHGNPRAPVCVSLVAGTTVLSGQIPLFDTINVYVIASDAGSALIFAF